MKEQAIGIVPARAEWLVGAIVAIRVPALERRYECPRSILYIP